MKKVNYKEKGITLVALVITIIILLILAGVTINTALSENGLFRMAKKAVNEYQESERQEQDAIEEITKEMEKISIDYNDYVGAYVTGYTPTGKKEENPCVIENETSGVTSNQKDGNPIEGVEENLEQKFTTEELDWRIWDYDKYTKTIRLISDKPTSKKLTLEGATGYNNGVWAVNEICRQCYGQYDENGNETKGITVANLRRTDIQKVSTYDYKNYKHKEGDWQENQTDGTIYFGSSKTYSSPRYSAVWGTYDSQWTYGYDGTKETGSDKECEMWEREYGDGMITGEGTGISNPTFKQSYYAHNFKDHEDQFINKEYYNLLFKTEDGSDYLNKIYWLAGRYVHLYESHCDLGLQFVDANSSYCGVDGYPLYTSNR